MVTMDYQAVDEVLVTHCVHRRNHDAVEGSVAGNDKFIGLSASANGANVVVSRLVSVEILADTAVVAVPKSHPYK